MTDWERHDAIDQSADEAERKQQRIEQLEAGITYLIKRCEELGEDASGYGIARSLRQILAGQQVEE